MKKNETPWRNSGGRFKTPKPGIAPAVDRVAILTAKLAEVGLLALVEQAAARYHVALADVLGRRRDADIVEGRREACVRLYVDAGCSSKGVGRFLGIDHSTALHHLSVAEVPRRDLAGREKTRAREAGRAA